MKYEPLSGPSETHMDTYSWRRRLLTACLAMGLFIATQLVLVSVLGAGNLNAMRLLADSGFSAAVLFLFAVFERRHSGGARALIGHDVGRTFKLCVAWTAGAYLVCSGLDIWLGYGRTESMFNSGGASVSQKVLFWVMALTFLPIFEELLYRHFLIRLFPLESRVWQWVAILSTSALYMFIHMPFAYWTSFLLIGTLAVILAYARVRSAGLLVPVLLHISAQVMAISKDLVAHHWF